MKHFLLSFFLISCLLSSAWAGFGGSRGGGYSSSRGSYSSRSSGASYFGGSRSGGSNVTISRPSSSGTVSTGSSGTVVNNYHSGSSSGFWEGWFWGNALSNHNSTVVVAGQPAVGGPVTVVQESHGFFYYFVWTIIVLGIIGALLWASEIFV